MQQTTIVHSSDRSIVVIGSSNVDLIFQLAHLPARGETVGNGQFSTAFGGKGANQAVAAARTGGRVTFITCLGNDESGRRFASHFKSESIATDHIQFIDQVSTGTAAVWVDAGGANSIAVAPGANGLLSVDIIQRLTHVIQSSAMVLIQLEIPIESVRLIVQIAADAGVPVMLNYAPFIAEPMSLTQGISFLVVNETEAAALLNISPDGLDDVQQAIDCATSLTKVGPECVVLTLGDKGVVAVEKSGVTHHQPAFKVKCVDTTAAGDTFCGALATALVDALPMTDALRFASAAAAISVTRLGAQPGIPTRGEIVEFLHAHQS